MKSLYPIRQVNNYLSAPSNVSKMIRHIFLLWFISFAIAASPVFSQGLVFQNPKLESGKAGADKATYRFPNVKSGLDALVSIKGRSSNKVSLVNIDVSNSGHAQSFQPQVSYNGGTAPGYAKWYMDFEVTIVKAGTKQKMKVAELDVTALDIDGNGDRIREFIIYNDPLSVITETVSSLKIDEQPVIDFDAEDGDPVLCGTCNKSTALVLCGTCSGSGIINTLINGLLRTDDCNTCDGAGKLHANCSHPYVAKKSKGVGKSFTYTGPTTNYASIDTFATQVMVTGTWVDTDEVVFRIGGENLSGGSQGAADRMYSLWFKEFRYLGAALLPVKLINWKASMVKQSVLLNWSSTQEMNASHYAVERSVDGRTFEQIGVVAASGNSDLKKDYNYTDNKPALHTAVCYYRLKSVDMDGRSQHSDVRSIRITVPTEQLVISTYPNPVVSVLNITVPQNWQGKKVIFEVFNINGMLVKTVVNNHAGQVEDMQVSTLGRGLYIVKATAGIESATQRMVKSN